MRQDFKKVLVLFTLFLLPLAVVADTVKIKNTVNAEAHTGGGGGSASVDVVIVENGEKVVDIHEEKVGENGEDISVKKSVEYTSPESDFQVVTEVLSEMEDSNSEEEIIKNEKSVLNEVESTTTNEVSNLIENKKFSLKQFINRIFKYVFSFFS